MTFKDYKIGRKTPGMINASRLVRNRGASSFDFLER